ncbi:hypothetical protein [Solibacillus sp. FSL K6-1554]|uniref:hypothetical protein n=1 Tax=Solibacillus sp. FSL K6-1554 TaxID=2921472 RepID=UPI0030FA2D91
MQIKYVRFQEIVKGEKDLDIVMTIATIQKQGKSGLTIESGPSYSSETTDLETYSNERVEYELSPEEFDVLCSLYENDKKAFLSFNRGEKVESTKH